MSGDSIEVLTLNNKLPTTVENNKVNYCGIYNLNSTTKTCIIDGDDSISSDSAIQTTLSEQLKSAQNIFDYSKQQQKCNYQLERFEKIYYEGENCNSNSLNVTVTKHLNRNQQVRGSFV